jgi:hypothetical protein
VGKSVGIPHEIDKSAPLWATASSQQSTPRLFFLVPIGAKWSVRVFHGPRTAHPSIIGPRTTHSHTLALSTTTTPTNTKTRCDHGDPPNDHAIVHNSPHSRAIAFKPFLISPPRRFAPSDALAAPVPLSLPRPELTTITTTRIHDFDNLQPRRIRGETISPPICIKTLPLAFECLGEAYPTF